MRLVLLAKGKVGGQRHHGVGVDLLSCQEPVGGRHRAFGVGPRGWVEPVRTGRGVRLGHAGGTGGPAVVEDQAVWHGGCGHAGGVAAVAEGEVEAGFGGAGRGVRVAEGVAGLGAGPGSCVSVPALANNSSSTANHASTTTGATRRRRRGRGGRRRRGRRASCSSGRAAGLSG